MVNNLYDTDIHFFKDPSQAGVTLNAHEVVSPWEHRSGSGIVFWNPSRGTVETNGREITLHGYHRASGVQAFLRITILAPLFPLREREVRIPYSDVTRIVTKDYWGQAHIALFHKSAQAEMVNVELFNIDKELVRFFTGNFPGLIERDDGS